VDVIHWLYISRVISGYAYLVIRIQQHRQGGINSIEHKIEQLQAKVKGNQNIVAVRRRLLETSKLYSIG
jgi:hypothetical protein